MRFFEHLKAAAHWAPRRPPARLKRPFVIDTFSKT
jgi:hypothetical protein